MNWPAKHWKLIVLISIIFSTTVLAGYSGENNPSESSVGLSVPKNVEIQTEAPKQKQAEVEVGEIIKSQIQVEREESKCHPSYSGCLNPNASDYDCAGGSGNGPYYTGRVRVLGPDVFGLDRDGDGIGCE